MARAASSGRLGLAAVVAMLALPAVAGDEVDYSAPYITVENGELVTRYPAKAHGKTNEESNAASPDAETPRVVPVALAVVLCLAVGVLLLRGLLASRSGRRAARN